MAYKHTWEQMWLLITFNLLLLHSKDTVNEAASVLFTRNEN